METTTKKSANATNPDSVKQESPTQTGHTRGPWRVQRLDPDGVVIIKEGYEIVTDDFDVVANINRGAPIRKRADAELIAAAPALLEALKLAESMLTEVGFDQDTPYSYRIGWEQDLRTVRRALATGKDAV